MEIRVSTVEQGLKLLKGTRIIVTEKQSEKSEKNAV